MVAVAGQSNFFARFAADFSSNYLVSILLWVFAVPDRRVGSVSRPGLVEVCVSSISQLVKTCAVHIDDTDGRLPLAYVFVTNKATKEHQPVVSL